MPLTRFKLVDVSGASHVEYKGVTYSLDPDEMSDEQAEMLLGKTPYVVKLPEAAARANPEPMTDEQQQQAATEKPASEEPALQEKEEPAPKPKRARL